MVGHGSGGDGVMAEEKVVGCGDGAIMEEVVVITTEDGTTRPYSCCRAVAQNTQCVQCKHVLCLNPPSFPPSPYSDAG